MPTERNPLDLLPGDRRSTSTQVSIEKHWHRRKGIDQLFEAYATSPADGSAKLSRLASRRQPPRVGGR